MLAARRGTAECLTSSAHGAFYFVRGIVSFKGRTFVFFAFFAFFGQQVSNNGRVRRELDVPRRARNKMEVAIWQLQVAARAVH